METGNLFTLILSLITIFNLILSAGVLFFERRDAGYTWAWLMVLFFIPILGFLIYIFLGRNLRKKNFYGLSNEEKDFLESEEKKQLSFLRNEEKHHPPLLNKYAELIRMNIKSSHGLLTNDNEIEIFNDGHQKFDSLINDIKSATKEINIQYYIIQPDSLGKKLRDELTKKAKEGLKVRLLYDEVGSKKISPKFFKDLRLAGGEVEVFFPSLLRPINFRINNRNHRKLCIIDGEIAYIGGFNVGDEYLGIVKKFGYWRDTHFKIQGSGSKSCTRSIYFRLASRWKA